MAEIYPYNETCVKINNVDEYRRCISMLKGCKKPLYESLDQIIDFLPNYMFIKIISNSIHLSYLTDDNIENKVELLNDVLSEEHIDPNIYTINDIKKIEYIINTGLKYNGPEYKSKKIKRLLEKYYINDDRLLNKKYKYKYVIFSFKNENELKIFGKYIIDNFSDILSVDDFNYFITTSIKYLKENYCVYFSFFNKDKKLDFFWGLRYYNSYNFDNISKVDYGQLYNINDLLNGVLNNIIIYGKDDIKPKYEPKKNTRLLENINKYPYDTIVINIRNKEELDIFYNNIHKYLDERFTSYNTVLDYIEYGYSKTYVRLINDNGRILYMFGDNYNIIDEDYDKIYNVNILINGNLDDLLKYGTISPKYEPKEKPKRLLENLSNLHLNKGKYKVISILIETNSEKKEFIDILKNTHPTILPDLGLPLCYVIFTENMGGFVKDKIYTVGYTGEYMSNRFYEDKGIEIGLSKSDISPVFDFNGFKRYISNIIPIYKPKNTKREL